MSTLYMEMNTDVNVCVMLAIIDLFFERGALVISITGEPVILWAPEDEMVCREMSAWPDIRIVPEFACVTVPEEIEYPFANYTTFRSIPRVERKG